MWIVFAHVATIFVGFALTVGVGIFLTAIVQGGDVRTIRTAVSTAIPLQTAGGILVFLAAVIGIIAAARFGYDFHARWLWISMILVGLILLDGFGRRFSQLKHLAKAAKDSPEDAPSPELRLLMEDRFERISNALSGVIWLSLLVMMIVKP